MTAYHISRIKFRGFKSFKSAEAEFPEGFVAIAGPNGSGKSNVTDAIRFIFGETSLKALRAKKTAELINLNCASAEVTIVIEGERRIEIRRQIREDGSTKYELEGRHVTREQALEALRPYGLEVGAHNIIGQGQVQNLVERNPKDRRQIIDAVAGIAEFEGKKKDALSELGKVETRISEARVVLAERGAFLAELEKEKDAALAFSEAKQTLERARATLVSAEYKKLDAYFKELLAKRKTLSDESDKLGEELGKLRAQKAELEKERARLGERIGKSSEAERLRTQAQELRLSIAQLEARLEEKKAERARLHERAQELKAGQERMKQALEQMQSDAAKLRAELEAAGAELETAKKAAGVQESETAASSLEKLEQALTAAVSARSSAEAGLEALRERVEQCRSEISRAEGELGKLGPEAAEDGRIARLQSTIDSLSAELEKLFEQEKKINRELPGLDQELLSAKEMVATLRGSVSPAAQNPALLTVAALKKDGMAGIWGPLSELIDTDPQYRTAVEAAGGGRLNHIVVDTMDTAEKIIAKLKAAKSGRATFIPLDSIVLQKREGGVPQGALGKLIDFITYDARVDAAMRYAFEETLLVSDVAGARKIGVGHARMVSLSGELLERTGAITGGTLRGSLMARGMLQKAEEDVERIKSERDGAYGRLHEVREEMAKRRRERAEAELKIQTVQAETGGAAGRKARAEQLKAEKERWAKQLEERLGELESREQKLAERVKEHDEAAARLSGARAAAESERKQRAKASSSAQEKFRTCLEKHAATQNSFHAREREVEMLRSQMMEQTAGLSDAEKQGRALGSTIGEMEKELAETGGRHKEVEAQLQAVSATVKKYYDQMQQLQGQLEELGKSEGSMSHTLEAAMRQAHDIDVKKAGVETKLADLKAEWEKYKEIELLDVGREKAEEMAREAEGKLSTLGNVNLKAPEAYEQKKKEINEVQVRVGTLESERAAVIGLMEEIETRKRSVFMDAFTRVNSHFKRLFGLVYAGEGTLVLEEPSNPLESGLSIRVRGVHDKRDKYLESMSGGEKTLLGLMFIFALHMHKPSPFYILDEAEASLDKENARKLADFVKQMSRNAQFIVVTHSDAVLGAADVVLGVTKDERGSRIVGVQLALGSQFVKKELAEGEQTLADGGIRTVPGKKAAGKAGAGAQEAETGSPDRMPASGAQPVSIPAPGQASETGLKNPAAEVREAAVKKRNKS